MTLWRISNYADLSGEGGVRVEGRWHHKGIPVVYLADSAALAMLEVLVHLEIDREDIPNNYQLLEIELPDALELAMLASEALPQGWQQRQTLTRSIGDEWLSLGKQPLLKVPSAIVPHSHNFLFNPRHPLAQQAVIKSTTLHPYDVRLVGC